MPTVIVAVALAVSGCVDSATQLQTTPPVDDFAIETPPLTDADLEADLSYDDLVFDSVEDCLQGSWSIDNEAYGAFFARNDDRVVSIDVSGLVTLTVELDTYRMFFTDWSIQYETGEPSFLIKRSGTETVQFVVTSDGVLEVVTRDDQIVLELFSLIPGGDGEAVGIATNDPGPLPLEGSVLECSAETLEVFVELDSFLFTRL